MAIFGTMNIVGSGLTAQQLRLDVISENITNINTTRTENGEGPYRRKMVVFQAEGGQDSFRMAMAKAAGTSNRGYERAAGVRVTEIVEDETDFPISAQYHTCKRNIGCYGRQLCLFGKCHGV